MAGMTTMPGAHEALPGRDTPMSVPDSHYVNGHPLKPPFPGGMQQAMFGMGCFWGAERRFWEQPGVFTTAVGYAAGMTPNPTYEEVCTGMTGHNEVVLVVFDPAVIAYEDLRLLCWDSPDPTPGRRQGKARGSQYRSGIFINGVAPRAAAKASLAESQRSLSEQGYGNSPRKSSMRRLFTMPRTITSNTSRKTRAVIAGWVERV